MSPTPRAAGAEDCVYLNPCPHPHALAEGPSRPPPAPPSFQGAQDVSQGPPYRHVLALWNKSDLYSRKGGVMRKTSRYRVLHLEGKCRASQGRTRPVGTKAPLSPHPRPSARQWQREKLSFQQKIKQASEPGAGWFP